MQNECPIPGAMGLQEPSGRGTSRVLIVGEAMGEQELEHGCGFYEGAPAGAVLERAIRRISCQRDMFVMYNAIPTHPPKNAIPDKLEGPAIAWGRPYLDKVIAEYQPRCILSLGNVALRATTGLSGRKLGVTHLSGYVLPSMWPDIPVVPCFHPSFLRRGKMSRLGVLMRCLRLAILVARTQRQAATPPVEAPPRGYILNPTETQTEDFTYAVKHINDLSTTGVLAYDIETPYSTDEEEAEEQVGAITSIQFSLAPQSGIYMPWREPFITKAKQMLASPCRKVNWNGWRFDDPRLREAACAINGEVIDLMWAWHHAQPDLPRGLQFAGAMQGPSIVQPSYSWPWPWKHLDNFSPQFYGIVDVDILQWLVSY